MTRIKVLLSLCIYLLGTLLLLCSDFYVSKNFDHIYVANWAALKSIIFVFGGICVFGFDQILMRKPELAINFLKNYLIQIFIISFIISFIIIQFFIQSLNIYFLSLIIMLFAFNQFWAAALRGNSQLIEAQIFTNGWKVAIFIFLMLGIYDQNIIYSGSFIAVLVINSIFIFKFLEKQKEIPEEKNTLEFYKMGSFFLLNNLSVTIATYGEQLLINSFGDKMLSYVIFNYVLAFNAIMLAFAGFLGFYFGPKLKLIKNMTVKIYYSYLKGFLIFSGFLAIISFILGTIIFKFYFHKDFSLLLALTCLGVGFVKVLYTIPSVCMALYCDTEIIKKISIFNIFNMIGFIILFYMVLSLKNDLVGVYIFMIMIVHWFLRLLNTHKFVVSSLRIKNANT